MKFKWPSPRIYEVGESNRVFMRRLAEAYGADLRDSEAIAGSVMDRFKEEPIRGETTEQVCDAVREAAR